MRTSRPPSTLSRNVFRSGTAVVTGLAAFGAVAGTGLGAGLAARETGRRDVQRAEQAPATDPASSRLLSIVRARPTRDVVRTRVVTESGAGIVGSGSPVRPVSSGGSSGGSSSSSAGSTSGAGSAPVHAAAPKPVPKPVSQPAPTTGS